MEDRIAEALDIEPYDFGSKTRDVMTFDAVDSADTMEEDFEFARDNIKSVIEKSTDALEDMLELARASENSRAYEVFSNLANTIANMSEQLVKIHEKRAKPQVGNGGTVTNNNLIVSSTEDVIRMLKEKKGEV